MSDLTAKQIREGYDDVLMKTFEEEKKKMQYRKDKGYDSVSELFKFQLVLKIVVWAGIYRFFVYIEFGLLFKGK